MISKTKKNKTHSMGRVKYDLHFTVSGFSILFLDLIFNIKTYGAVDYRVLLENDVSSAYLTKKGQAQAFKLSEKLLKDAFFEKIFSDSELLNKKLQAHRVSALNDRNVLEEWRKYVALIDEFCRLYRFYEQPFQQALEKIILDQISENKLAMYLSNADEESLRKLHLDSYGRQLLEKLLKLGRMKLELHMNMGDFTVLGKFIGYVSRKNKLPEDSVLALTVSEFEDAITGNVTNVDLAKERLTGCALVKKNNTWHFESGKKYQYWKNMILGKNQKREISGNVAYPGKVIGKAVLHLSWTDTTEPEEGDILITGMTNPQMIPYIKKAGAIVTDEGGITCHAAIISRELKKPCITGAKIATQIIKTGDLVEVDADNGAVRIIKRKK